jgi:hypothetical protein
LVLGRLLGCSLLGVFLLTLLLGLLVLLLGCVLAGCLLGFSLLFYVLLFRMVCVVAVMAGVGVGCWPEVPACWDRYCYATGKPEERLSAIDPATSSTI